MSKLSNKNDMFVGRRVDKSPVQSEIEEYFVYHNYSCKKGLYTSFIQKAIFIGNILLKKLNTADKPTKGFVFTKGYRSITTYRSYKANVSVKVTILVRYIVKIRIIRGFRGLNEHKNKWACLSARSASAVDGTVGNDSWKFSGARRYRRLEADPLLISQTGGLTATTVYGRALEDVDFINNEMEKGSGALCYCFALQMKWEKSVRLPGESVATAIRRVLLTFDPPIRYFFSASSIEPLFEITMSELTLSELTLPVGALTFPPNGNRGRERYLKKWVSPDFAGSRYRESVGYPGKQLYILYIYYMLVYNSISLVTGSSVGAVGFWPVEPLFHPFPVPCRSVTLPKKTIGIKK